MTVWKKVGQSFVYAWEGLVYAILTQRNMRIHLSVALVALVMALFLDITKDEILLLFFTIVLVITAELFNTAVETVVDLVTDRYHPLAKIAKDVAAGAVLLTAILAVVIGFFLFYDKLFPLRLRPLQEMEGSMIILFFVCLGIFLILFFFGLAMKRRKNFTDHKEDRHV